MPVIYINNDDIRLNSSSSDKVVVNGSLGIGTTSPAYTLDVAGVIRSGTSYRASINGDGSGALLMFGSATDIDSLGVVGAYASLFNISSGNGDISFQFNNTERMRITTAGNVGIGTTAPNRKLHVESSGVIADFKSTTNQGLVDIIGTSNQLRIGTFSGSVGLAYGTGTSPHITIVSGGNVGIGTTSPTTAKLVVDTSSLVAASFGRDGTDGDVVQVYNGASGTTKVIALGASGNDGTIYSQFGNLILQQSAGNVGIGTASPAEKLHVNSGSGNVPALFESTDSLSLITFKDNSTTTTVGVGGAANNIVFYSASERMRIDGSGNVGIGTTSPSAKLHIDGGTTGDTVKFLIGGNDSIIKLGDNGAGGPHGIQFDYETTNGDGMSMYYRTTPQHIVFENSTGTSGTGVMVIQRAGNVGIGNTSPDAHLHINGTGTTASGNQYHLIVGDDNTYGINKGGGIIFRGDYNSSGAQANFGAIRAGKANANDGNANAYLSLLYGASGTLTEGLRLDYNGNVGIGTTSPAAKLDVAGQIITSDSVRFTGNVSTPTGNSVFRPASNTLAFGTASAERMRIDASGNVGIGTISPDTKLHVVNGDVTGAFYDGSSVGVFESNNPYVQIIGTDSGNQASSLMLTTVPAAGTGNNKHWTLQHRGTSQSGNFGISYDTTSASGQDGADGTDKFVIDTSGNVGIGTTSPDAKLHVDGSWTSNRGTISINGPANGLAGIGITSNNIYRGGLIHRDGTSGQSLELAAYSSEPLLLKTANTTRITIASAGNVGIGTTAPIFNLHVLGTSGGDSTFTDGILIDNNNATDGEPTLAFRVNSMVASGNYWLTGLNQSANYKIAYGTSFTDANTILTVGNNGNVGIGTTSPANKLHVVGSSSDTAGTGLLRIEGGGGGGNVSWTFRSTVTNNDLTLDRQYAGAYYQALTFQRSSGNVGIGTTNPTKKLHVAGDILIEDSSPSIHLLDTTNNTDSYIYTFDDGSLALSADENNEQAGSKFLFYIDGSEKVRISDAGNVGIGTTSPTSKLHVEYAGGAPNGLLVKATTNRSKIVVSDNDTSAYVIAENSYASYGMNDSLSANNININISGNVGIGTTSPLSKLQVRAGLDQNFRVYSGTNLTVASINDADTAYAPVTFRASTFDFQNGNVGIGTTGPSYKLDVVANTNDGIRLAANNALIGGGATGGDVQLIYWNGSIAYYGRNSLGGSVSQHEFRTGGGTRLIVDSTGNVGIGTTSPDSKFHVEDTNPEVRITGTGGTSFPRLLWEYPVSATQASRWALTASASGNTFYLYNYTQSKKIFQVDGTASHITLNHDAAGTTQIGTSTTQTAYQLYVATNVGQTGAIEAAGSVKITSGALGVNIAASATAGRIDASNDIVAYSTSDKRLKENIKPLENATEKVKKLTGVEFDWKQEHKDVHGYEGHDVGVIAQEVQEVLPEAIRTNDSGYLSVRYEKLIGLLIESNKELAARIEELEQKLK